MQPDVRSNGLFCRSRSLRAVAWVALLLLALPSLAVIRRACCEGSQPAPVTCCAGEMAMAGNAHPMQQPGHAFHSAMGQGAEAARMADCSRDTLPPVAQSYELTRDFLEQTSPTEMVSGVLPAIDDLLLPISPGGAGFVLLKERLFSPARPATTLRI